MKIYLFENGQCISDLQQRKRNFEICAKIYILLFNVRILSFLFPETKKFEIFFFWLLLHLFFLTFSIFENKRNIFFIKTQETRWKTGHFFLNFNPFWMSFQSIFFNISPHTFYRINIEISFQKYTSKFIFKKMARVCFLWNRYIVLSKYKTADELILL